MIDPDPIPVNEPVVGEAERRHVLDCLESGWISSEGPMVGRFEEAFAAAVGRRHAVAVSSGTGALDVAVRALGLGPGDEVVLPTLSIISCPQSVVRAGATPVLVDVDPASWNADVAAIEARLTDRTRAVMAVHTYGLPVDMIALEDLARRRGLLVLEDAAEAIGLTLHGRPCGSFGDLSIVSFYPNKHVTTGEGGMCLTDDDALAARCRSLRNLCFQPGRRFVHEELGFNYRMTSLQAALGLGQLERLEASVARKRAIGGRYRERLASTPGLQLPLARVDGAENVYWVFGLVLGDEVDLDADELRRRLGERRIGSRPFFWPIHEQPVFRRMGLFEGEGYPVAERLARRGLYLPGGLALTDEAIDRVASEVESILEGLR